MCASYRVTDLGMATAVFLTRVHNRLIRIGLAELTDPDPPMTTPLRTAMDRLNKEIDHLAKASCLAV